MERVTPAEALAVMDEHMGRLRALLERFEPSALLARTPSGEWCALENVRHVLHAEQHHLGRYVPGGLGASNLALPQGQHTVVAGPTRETT